MNPVRDVGLFLSGGVWCIEIRQLFIRVKKKDGNLLDIQH